MDVRLLHPRHVGDLWHHGLNHLLDRFGGFVLAEGDFGAFAAFVGEVCRSANEAGEKKEEVLLVEGQKRLTIA
jgi:hypothetical protein